MTGPKRRELAVPAGWRPSHHSTVQVLDSVTLHPVEIPVAGLWRVIDRAPAGGWWLQPADERASQWRAAHGSRAGVTSGMVNVHAQRLVPSWLQLPMPWTT